MRHAWRAFAVAMLCILPTAAAVELIELHGPEGQRAFVNTHSVSSLREPTDADLRTHFARGTRCVVVLMSGRFMAVRESCDEIRALMARER